MPNVTLHLGDCLEYMRGMADKSVDAVITDPPYGIAYQSARRIDSERFAVISGDTQLDFSWMTEARRITKDSGCLFCFCRWDTEREFFDALDAAGWNVQSQVIWDRGIHGLGDLRRQFAPMHDNAWFATARDYEFPGSRPKSVYRVDRLSADKLLHPTQKPSGLMQRIILDVTARDWTVFDPFSGSGTTAIACMQTGRNFIGCEIDPQYYAIAERRIRDAQAQPSLFEGENAKT